MSKASRHGGLQRRVAAVLLKCGESRVWMDSTAGAKIARAITRSDVRRLIKEGLIKELSAKKNSPNEHGRRNTGSRKGARGARTGKKEPWLNMVRPQRKMLQQIKKELPNFQYRKLYRLVKGGVFRSRSHLQAYLNEKGLVKKK